MTSMILRATVSLPERHLAVDEDQLHVRTLR
jgi:hypothetical protein